MKRLLLISVLLLPISLFPDCIFPRNNRGLNILILGNSVTYCPPNPSIGWEGNWGMAASAAEKDFESLLQKKITDSKKFEPAAFTIENVSDWEKDFNYDLNRYPEISNKQYDLIIVRLGENVDDNSPHFLKYKAELTKLIKTFETRNSKVIITGSIWFSPEKDDIHQSVAKENNYYYISLIDFQANQGNYATGQFADAGVSAHPSDTGMEEIANLLFKQIIAIY